jgi:hypothetical protein
MKRPMVIFAGHENGCFLFKLNVRITLAQYATVLTWLRHPRLVSNLVYDNTKGRIIAFGLDRLADVVCLEQAIDVAGLTPDILLGAGATAPIETEAAEATQPKAIQTSAIPPLAA